MNTIMLALVVLQLQRLMPRLRALVKRDELVVRIADHLGVPREAPPEQPMRAVGFKR